MQNIDVLELVKVLKKNDFNGYISFLQKNLPRYLYRYCSHKTQNMKSLISAKIKLSNPKDFNDPFDSLIHVVNKTEKHYFGKIDRTIQKILYSTDTKVRELKKNILKRNILSSEISYKDKYSIIQEEKNYLLSPNITPDDIQLKGISWEMEQFSGFANRYMGDFVSDSGIACFSEEKNDVIMLAHYGMSHSGFCIEYKTDNIIQDVEDGKYFIVPVFYSDDIYQDYNEVIYDERLTFLWNLPQFMYKGERWKYEHEWRIVKFNDTDNELDFDYIHQIFLGSEFSNINNYVLSESGNSEEEQILCLVNLFEYCSNRKINIVPLRALTQKYELEEWYLL